MKKISALLLTFLLSISLIGCKKATPEDPTKTPVPLTEQQIREIVNQKVPKNKLIKFSFDGKDKIPNYDISVSDENYKYTYEINANTGAIIKEEKEKILINNKKAPTPASISVDEAKAKEIALAQNPNGTIIEYSFDENDTIPVYEITVSDKTNLYEYKINAIDGSIMKQETKKLPN